MRLYIYRNNEQSGPFDEAAVLDALRSGRLSTDDLGVREGEQSWSRLGDIFAGQFQEPGAGFAFSQPALQPAASSFAPAGGPAKAAGGCRRPFGWLMLSIGLLLLMGGGLLAIATSVAYTTPLCPIADADEAAVRKLSKEYESAKGTPNEVSAQIDLERALDSYKSSNEMCGRELATKRMFQGAGVFAAVTGLLLAVIGFFVRRVRAT